MSKAEEQNIEHLSLVQIKNYLENRLDNSAKHEVERHLLDCEFCREAFEGYQLMGVENAEEEVGKIIRVMRSRVGRQVPFYRNYRFYGVAASILLIAGIVFVFDIGSQNEQEVAAKEEVTLDQVPTEEIAVESLDSNLVTETQEREVIADAAPATEEKEEVILEEPAELPAASPVVAEVTEEIEEREEDAPVSEVFSALSEAREINPEALSGAAQGEAEDRGFTFDDQDVAQEPTGINLGGGEDIAVAPSKQDDNFVTPQTVPQEQAKRQQATAATTRASAPSTSDIEPQPIFGLDDYKTYLQSELIYPTLATQNNVEGEVVLRFVITTEGVPSNIEVVQSLGYGCDEEAIRLVQEGERWFPGTTNGESVEKPVTLTVPFKLP